MNVSLSMNDGRLLARVIQLAHRFGCTYTTVQATQHGTAYRANLAFDGPEEALRRLEAQITKLLNDDMETFS